MLNTLSWHLPGDHLPQPHANCYWLVPGLIMAGEYPGAPFEASARKRLQSIIAGGVRQFVDLTEPHELEPYAPLLKSLAGTSGPEAAHVRHPIQDMSVPTPAGMRAILDELADAAAAGRCTYVHCWGGIGRTGTVVGCLLVEAGLSPDEAIKLIATKWQVMAKRDHWPQSPQTPEQFAFIRNWKAGGPRTR